MTKKKNKKLSLAKFKQTKIILTTRQKYALAIICIPAIIALGWIIIRAAQNQYVTQQISQARAHNEPAYNNKRSQQIGALHSAAVITSASPAYSSKIDVCYVTHEDAGWTAINWYQDCYIRYTDLFQTSSSRSDVMRQLETNSASATLFDEPNTFQPKTCDALYKNRHKPTLIYLDLTTEPNDRGIDCNIPNPMQDFSSVRGPIILDKNLTIRAERSYDSANIDQSKKYILLQSDNYYYREDLGCGVGFMCPSPRADPITGF